MSDLKKQDQLVREMYQTDSFFLCLEQSARHFDLSQVNKLDLMLKSARHRMQTSVDINDLTIYINKNDTTFSYCADQKQVTHHA